MRGKNVRLYIGENDLDFRWFFNTDPQSQEHWTNIYQTLKENECQPRFLYPAKLSFRFAHEIKPTLMKTKLKELRSRKPAHQNILSKTFPEYKIKKRKPVKGGPTLKK